jgi:hypothetical protein
VAVDGARTNGTRHRLWHSDSAQEPRVYASRSADTRLGIGANSAMFSVVYGILVRPLPYPHADRVALVYVHFSPQDTE